MECKNSYLESLLIQILNRTFNIKYTPGLMLDSYQENAILAFHNPRIILNKIWPENKNSL